MNVTHQSRPLRRFIIGGITTMVLAGSTVAFAGEAAAQQPRDTTNTAACTMANHAVRIAWINYDAVSTIPYAGTDAYAHYNAMRAERNRLCN